MKRLVFIRYGDIPLQVPTWLSGIWRYDLPLKDFPSFCGAGGGLGDWLVPEKMYGAIVSPACFVHDIMWSTSYDSYMHFQRANNIFYWNLRACVNAQLPGLKCQLAHMRCLAYYLAVSTVGIIHFDPLGVNPWSNRDAQEKLRRVLNAPISA